MSALLERAIKEDRLLEPPEVAKILRYTVRHVWKLARDGKLQRIKPEGTKYVRFDPHDVKDFIDRGRGPTHQRSRARVNGHRRRRF